MDSKDHLGCEQDTDGHGRSQNKASKIAKMDKSDQLRRKQNRWVVIAFACSFALSIFMTTLSESVVDAAGSVVVTVLVVLLIVLISILFDIIGTAVTAADKAPINSMNTKRIFGSDKAVYLINNADRVSNICNDIVGDICGVVSGVASSYIVAIVAVNGNLWAVIGSLTIPALVGALTVSGKAYGKRTAIGESKTIVFKFGVMLSFFSCIMTKILVYRKKRKRKSNKYDYANNGKGIFKQTIDSLRIRI